MTRYLLNSAVLTAFGEFHYDGPLPLREACTFALSSDLVSAVGHAATARFMSAVLGVPVACQRVEVEMQIGDQALVLKLGARLPEGALLDDDDLRSVPYAFGLLTRTG